MSALLAHSDIELTFSDRPLRYRAGGIVAEVPAKTPFAFWGAKPHQLVALEKGGPRAMAIVPLAKFMSWSLPGAVKTRLLHGDVLIGDENTAEVASGWLFQRWARDIVSNRVVLERAVELEMEALLHRMAVGRWSHLAASPSRSSFDVERAAEMASYIAEHSSDRLAVKDVAAAVHMSQGQAAALFRQVLGESITRYINLSRVVHAQRLLLTTSLDTGSIGRQIGFGSPSSFHEVFRAVCGTSPAQWRRQHELPAPLLPLRERE